MPYRYSILLFALVVLPMRARAQAVGDAADTRLATVKTKDGRTLNGLARFQDDLIVIQLLDGVEQKLKLAEVGSATFRDAPAPVEAKVDEPSTGGLKAEYFDDQELRKPKLVRYDPQLDFGWGLGPPDPSVNSDFSARWTGRIEAKFSETHTFYTHADDGLRLWIDGKLLMDHWIDRPPFEQKASVALKAGRKHDIKIEFHDSTGEAWMQLGWSSPSQPRQIVPASRFSPPDDGNVPPRVSLVTPKAQRWQVAPGAMDLEATASAQKGSIARVEFFAGSTLLGTATTQPYSYKWAHVPPGHHRLTARATDSAGIVSASAPVSLNVAANGSGTLPAPWGSMRLGVTERTDSAAYSGGLFTIRAGGGEMRGAFDSGYLIAQPLDGDGQITARIGDVSTEGSPNAAAGIMIRESLAGDSRYAAILAGKEGIEYLRRREPASWVASTDANRAVPCYLRLIRNGNLFKAYASENGTSWQLIGTDQVAIGSQAYVGLIATSRSDDTMCTVCADHVNIEAGPATMDASASGVRMRNGSFIAGWIGKADASQVVLSRQAQKRLTLNDGDIARLVMRPVPMELAGNIGRGRTGVLLASGDFYEGEFRDVRDGRVTVDSVVFGVRTFAAGEVLAVALHDVDEAAKAVTVRTGDGSVYVVKSLQVEGGKLHVLDEWAGDVLLSARDVVEVRR